MVAYPVVLDLRARPVLVVGGGAVAERKVEGLLEAGGRVTVLSPTLTPRLADWVAEGRIRHVARAYRDGDVPGYHLVFVATSDGAVNAAVARAARGAGVWVNVADEPRHCDFTLPSVLRRGALTVAVATGGASPALSRAVREELERHLTDDYAALAGLVGEVRRELRARHASPDGDRWRRALQDDLRGLLRDGRYQEAKQRLLARLGAG